MSLGRNCTFNSLIYLYYAYPIIKTWTRTEMSVLHEQESRNLYHCILGAAKSAYSILKDMTELLILYRRTQGRILLTSDV